MVKSETSQSMRKLVAAKRPNPLYVIGKPSRIRPNPIFHIRPDRA